MSVSLRKTHDPMPAELPARILAAVSLDERANQLLAEVDRLNLAIELHLDLLATLRADALADDAGLAAFNQGQASGLRLASVLLANAVRTA